MSFLIVIGVRIITVMVMNRQSELLVITKAKDLCSYILIITDKLPKKFRFTLVSRLQNYALSIIENLLLANEVKVMDARNRTRSDRLEIRRNYQQMAFSNSVIDSIRKIHAARCKDAVNCFLVVVSNYTGSH